MASRFSWVAVGAGQSQGSSGTAPHSICDTVVAMKTTQLPPVRITPAVREEVESVLREGESLSEFVAASVLEAARRRKLQQAFLARGRASLAKAKSSRPLGGHTPVDQVLDEVQERLRGRMATHRAMPGQAVKKT